MSNYYALLGNNMNNIMGNFAKKKSKFTFSYSSHLHKQRQIEKNMCSTEVEGIRSIVNQKISYWCEQESQDLI
jgi:hypothetical protein